MSLTKIFTPEQYERALASWQWIGLDEKIPVLTSQFGDVFLHSEQGMWFLDTLQGTLSRLWDGPAALERELNTAEGQDRYLLGGLAFAAQEHGLQLGQDQVYDFVHPPILGGEVNVENLTAIDFVVGVNIAGQIHDQVRTAPPGTPVKLAIHDPTETS